MRYGLLCSALLFLTLGCAGDMVVNKQLKPDLEQIVVDQKVSPVAGITAAGQPDRAAFEVFAASGYSTVIDMRGAQENRGLNEEAVVAELGMEYIAFPITSAEQINFDSAAKLEQLIADAEGPVLVHCASSNRVGALLALRASLAGTDDDAAIVHGIDAGLTSLKPVVDQLLSEAP